MNKEEFDRSRCMSYFDDHRKLVKRIERMRGVEVAYKVQSSIIDYGLYGIFPDDDEILQYIPEPILNQIDRNQERRERCFAGEDLEMSRSIILMHRDHPEYSQNKIVQLLKTSKGKVNKTLQKYKNGEYEGIIELSDTNTYPNPITNPNTNTYPNTYTTVTTTEPMTDFAGTTKYESLDDVPTDVIYEIYDFYQNGKDYNYISRNTGLNNDQIGAIIEDGMSYRFTAPEDRPFS